MVDVVWGDEQPWRRMTLAEAQAIECNRCGDCCDSYRQPRMRDGALSWFWGNDLDGEAVERGIIPLREAVRGYSEVDTLHRPGDYIGGFRCRSLVPRDDGTADCSAHDGERPSLCGDFPVYGRFEELIIEGVRERGEHEVLPANTGIPRCAWHRVLIVATP